MQQRTSEFLVGLLFGTGLIVSGMTDPGKVIGFLDLFGAWDPSLALVMGGAVIVSMFAFALARKRTTAFLGGAMRLPTSREIDGRLVIGGLMFGAGWGLAGFCPGPALVSLAAGQPKAAVFVVAMLAGMLLFESTQRRAPSATPSRSTLMAVPIRELAPTFAVAPQLAPEDVPEIAARGFATIVNNRPDGEGGSSQPASHDLEQAAKAAGLHYVHLPVVGGAITSEQALAMRRLLDSAPLPLLAFCRTGTRSAQLYELACNAG